MPSITVAFICAVCSPSICTFSSSYLPPVVDSFDNGTIDADTGSDLITIIDTILRSVTQSIICDVSTAIRISYFDIASAYPKSFMSTVVV